MGRTRPSLQADVAKRDDLSRLDPDPGDQLGPGAHVKLSEHPLQRLLDGVLGDPEAAGDLAVG